MSESNDGDDGRPVERKAVIFLGGFYAPVLGALLCEAEMRCARDPLALQDVRALRQDIERQVLEQFPKKGWLFNHGD